MKPEFSLSDLAKMAMCVRQILPEGSEKRSLLLKLNIMSGGDGKNYSKEAGYMAPSELEMVTGEPIGEESAVWLRWILPSGRKGPWKLKTYHEAKIDCRIDGHNEIVVGNGYCPPPENYGEEVNNYE